MENEVYKTGIKQSGQEDFDCIAGEVFGRVAEPSSGLEARILMAIFLARRSSVRRRIGFFSVLLAGSMAFFGVMLNLLVGEMQSSGTWQFLSLIFTDYRMILVNWQAYLLSLVESAPMMSIAAVLAAISIALVLLKELSRNIRLRGVNFKLLKS